MVNHQHIALVRLKAKRHLHISGTVSYTGFLPEYTNDSGKSNQNFAFTKSGLEDKSKSHGTSYVKWSGNWARSNSEYILNSQLPNQNHMKQSFRLFLTYNTLGGQNARRISNSLLPVKALEDGSEISAGFPALELQTLEKLRLFGMGRSHAYNGLCDPLGRTWLLFSKSTSLTAVPLEHEHRPLQNKLEQGSQPSISVKNKHINRQTHQTKHNTTKDHADGGISAQKDQGASRWNHRATENLQVNLKTREAVANLLTILQMQWTH